MNWGNGIDWTQLMQRHPMLAQRFQRPLGQPQQGGGYDSSGINPHGMYSGTFGQHPMGQQMPRDFPRFQQSQPAPFPSNPGGFNPMGGLAAFLHRR